MDEAPLNWVLGQLNANENTPNDCLSPTIGNQALR